MTGLMTELITGQLKRHITSQSGFGQSELSRCRASRQLRPPFLEATQSTLIRILYLDVRVIELAIDQTGD